MVQRLTQPFKLVLMFVPLLLLFMAVGVVAYDLKHPVVHQQEACWVSHIGQSSGASPSRVLGAIPLKAYKVLYHQGGTPQSDVRFLCAELGAVMINDPEVFRYSHPEVGHKAQMTHRKYRLWPEQWFFQIY